MGQYYLIPSDELYHHGVPGMKWGHRKDKKKNQAAKQTIPLHEDYIRAHTKKSVKSMSDQELRSRLNRYDMESKYTKYSNEGKRTVDRIMKNVGTVVTVTGAALTIYQNADKIYNITSNFLDKFKNAKVA